MIWWCIYNSIKITCFTILAIVAKHWWVVLFAFLFYTSYKELLGSNKEKKGQANEPKEDK